MPEYLPGQFAGTVDLLHGFGYARNSLDLLTHPIGHVDDDAGKAVESRKIRKQPGARVALLQVDEPVHVLDHFPTILLTLQALQVVHAGDPGWEYPLLGGEFESCATGRRFAGRKRMGRHAERAHDLYALIGANHFREGFPNSKRGFGGVSVFVAHVPSGVFLRVLRTRMVTRRFLGLSLFAMRRRAR